MFASNKPNCDRSLGIGWLLIASLRRVLLGFLLGAVVAILVGFLIGMSRPMMLVLNPIIQILKPVSPLAWLPIALAIFNLSDPSAIFVIILQQTRKLGRSRNGDYGSVVYRRKTQNQVHSRD